MLPAFTVNGYLFQGTIRRRNLTLLDGEVTSFWLSSMKCIGQSGLQNPLASRRHAGLHPRVLSNTALCHAICPQKHGNCERVATLENAPIVPKSVL